MVTDMNVMIVVWTYAALIFAGGLMGFLKAKSKASLVMSTACAIPLVLVASGQLPMAVAQGVSIFLLLFFTRRYVASRKVMPALAMAVLSLVAGILLFTLGRR